MTSIKTFIKQLFCRHTSLHIKIKQQYYVKDALDMYEGEVTIVSGACLNCGKDTVHSKDRIHYEKRMTRAELDEYIKNKL